MPNPALGKHECLNCSNLFIASQSDADDIFKKQYCSKSCQEEDIASLEDNKIPEEELSMRTTEQSTVANAAENLKTIAGGFKIQP